MRNISKLNKVIQKFKSILFKNKDILTGEELVEYKIISNESKKRLNGLKQLRNLNNIYYIWDYNEEFKKLIFSYKYNKKKNLAILISELIKEEFEYVLKREKIDIILSVPINIKRKNERGFNQVDEILKELKVKFLEIKREKNTEKMHKLLDEKLREDNIKGSFKINQNIDFNNKNILIFDDIVTTGATLREIKNSILDSIKKNNKIKYGLERNIKINVIIFCLAAAREIKISKGEI